MAAKVTLVDVEGPTSIHIGAEITDGGDLVVSGQDLRQAPREAFGETDYEYWLKIKAPFKDHLLLALMETLYSGNTSVVSELKDYLYSKGIPCEFDSYA